MELIGNAVRIGNSSRCCDAIPPQGIMVSEGKPLFRKSRPGLGWEGFRSLDKSEDLPVITQLLQPAVNGKLIKPEP